jgi:hypothetical protein
MFSYVSREERVPANHPLRPIRKLTYGRILARCSGDRTGNGDRIASSRLSPVLALAIATARGRRRVSFKFGHPAQEFFFGGFWHGAIITLSLEDSIRLFKVVLKGKHGVGHGRLEGSESAPHPGCECPVEKGSEYCSHTAKARESV